MFQTSRLGVRMVGAAVVATMVLGTAIGAEAATKKKIVKHTRTVTLTYTGGCSLEASVGGRDVAGNDGGLCDAVGAADYALTAKTGEKYVSVKVTDATGQPIPGAFWIANSINSTAYPFCGVMKSFKLPSPSIGLDLDAIGAVDSCPGVATNGKIAVTFSNLP